jgi:hypothetical protein
VTTRRELTPDFCLYLKGMQHGYAEDLTLTAGGAGTTRFGQVPQGFVWVVDSVSVAGAGVGRITLYRGAVTPDAFMATKVPTAGAPGESFDFGGALTWLRQGERIVVDITGGSASAQVVATVYFRLFEVAARGARPETGDEGAPDYLAEPWGPRSDDYPDPDTLTDRTGGSSQDSDGRPVDPGRGRPVEPDSALPPPDDAPVPAPADVL